LKPGSVPNGSAPEHKARITVTDDEGRADGQDPLAQSLAQSISRASEAGQWDVVKALAAELRALRHERDGVLDLAGVRARRGG
jgi:hypothetical protein